VGGRFYFIAQSGWDRLDGQLKAGAVFEPPAVRVIDLHGKVRRP
jgi:hypothetical protein